MRGVVFGLAVGLAAAVLALGGALASAPSAAAAPTSAADRAVGKAGARWLAGRPAGALSPGLQADVIVALRSAGARPAALRPRARRLADGAQSYARTAGAAAKVVLAAEAAGLDPRKLGGTDYVRRITSRHRAGRFGRSSFDQALSMVALRSAGRRVPRASIRFLTSRRGQGGWGFDLRKRGRDEVDTTALLVIALRAAGASPRSAPIRGAMAWLAQQRNREGGYAVRGAKRRTGANATALVIQAEIAVGRTPRPSTVAALRTLRTRSGAVRFTRASTGNPAIATAGAVPALMGKGLTGSSRI